MSFLAGDEKRTRQYDMKLNDFFTKAWIQPRLSLVYSWDFPQKQIILSKRHPVQSLIFFQFQDDTISVFINSTKTASGEEFINLVTINEVINNICWFPSRKNYFF